MWTLLDKLGICQKGTTWLLLPACLGFLYNEPGIPGSWVVVFCWGCMLQAVKIAVSWLSLLHAQAVLCLLVSEELITCAVTRWGMVHGLICSR
jgi:hypothetical protein